MLVSRPHHRSSQRLCPMLINESHVNVALVSPWNDEQGTSLFLEMTKLTIPQPISGCRDSDRASKIYSYWVNILVSLWTTHHLLYEQLMCTRILTHIPCDLYPVETKSLVLSCIPSSQLFRTLGLGHMGTSLMETRSVNSTLN